MKLKKSDVVFYTVLVLTALAVFLCSRYVIQLAFVHGTSMMPTYHDKQIVFINRISRDFKAGDVIIFDCDALDEKLIKRVAAVPGDEVKITDGHLFINGELSPLYPDSVIFVYGGIAEDGLTLKDGEYFCIGDNVSGSRDSRFKEVGIVKDETILGRLVCEKPFEEGEKLYE